MHVCMWICITDFRLHNIYENGQTALKTNVIIEKKMI
jgi:hypothetical protein